MTSREEVLERLDREVHELPLDYLISAANSIDKSRKAHEDDREEQIRLRQMAFEYRKTARRKLELEKVDVDEGDVDLEWVFDKLCANVAMDGDCFFPPRETAQECMDAVADFEQYQYSFDDPLVEQLEVVLNYYESYGWERGQHSRAWSDATEFFIDMERAGLDPIGRVERYNALKRLECDVTKEKWPDTDWEWLEVTRFTKFSDRYDDEFENREHV